MYGRSSASEGSTIRVPVKAGAARSSSCQAIGVRRSRAARRGSNGRRSRSACSPRRRSCSTLFSRSSVSRRPGSSSEPTTPMTREASSTCIVGGVYSGAILTAVCWRDVVAPPIRSGSVEATPLHLLRDDDHLVERGRDEAREADDVAALLDGGVEDRVGRDHHAQVDHLVAVAAEHDADDVLADVVDVALDGRQHDAARRLPSRRPSPPPCTARGRRPRASSRARS